MKLVTDAVNPIKCDDSTSSADARCAQVRNINGQLTKPIQVLRPSNNPADLRKLTDGNSPLKVVSSSNTKITDRKPLPVLRPNSGTRTGDQFQISRPVHVVKASPAIKPINDAQTVHVINPVAKSPKPEDKVYIVEPVAVIKSDGGPAIKVINQAPGNKPLEVRRPSSPAPVNKPTIQIKRPGDSHLQHKPVQVHPSAHVNRQIQPTNSAKHLEVRRPGDSPLPIVKPVPIHQSAIVKRLGEPLEVRRPDTHNKRSIPIQVRRPSNSARPSSSFIGSSTLTSNQPIQVRRPGSHTHIVKSSSPRVIEVRRPGGISTLRVTGSTKPIEVKRPSTGTSILGGNDILA